MSAQEWKQAERAVVSCMCVAGSCAPQNSRTTAARKKLQRWVEARPLVPSARSCGRGRAWLRGLAHLPQHHLEGVRHVLVLVLHGVDLAQRQAVRRHLATVGRGQAAQWLESLEWCGRGGPRNAATTDEATAAAEPRTWQARPRARRPTLPKV